MEVGAAPGVVVLTLFGVAIKVAISGAWVGERPLPVEDARTVRFDGRAPRTVTLGLE